MSSRPTATIYGSAAIVNVGQGTFFPYNADAIAGFTSIALRPDLNGTYPPGPSFAAANSSEAVRRCRHSVRRGR